MGKLLIFIFSLIKIWNSMTGALVEIFKSHERAVNDTCIVENYLITCSEDKSVKIWDLRTLSLLKTINFGEPVIRVSNYRYAANNIIIACSETGKIFTFDLASALNESNLMDDYDTGNLITKFWFDKTIVEKHNLKKIKNSLQLTSMAVSPLGILVCGFNEGILSIWDLDRILNVTIVNKKFLIDFDRYLIFLEYTHSSLVHLTDFNKKGNYFYTGSTDGSVLVWKVHADIIQQIRQANVVVDKTVRDYVFPVYSIFNIKESDGRVRCQVNAVIWSCCDNFIISLISSKKRKRTLNNPNEGVHAGNSNGEASCKRSSSINIYDINRNSIINKLSEDNGFNIHDECYVLEAHPRVENLILTVNTSNEVLVVNFITNQIVSKFKEENYFFNNISQTILASEGKFSRSGGLFVISTFLGSISIYTGFPIESYSGTYMNQFFDVEFNSNPDILDQFFPKYVNMHNLPYIAQQPYDKLKLEQIESNRVILANYNLSNKDINCRLLNNNDNYTKTLEERILEVEREEKIFSLAAKENLTYMIQEIPDVDSNIDQMSIVDDESEVFEPEEDLDVNNNDNGAGNKDDDENALSGESIMSVDYIGHYESEDEHEEGLGMYNLRSRRSKHNGRRTRNNNNTDNNTEEVNNITNNVSSRATRYLTRNNKSQENSPTELINKPRRRLRKIRDISKNIEEDGEEIEIVEEEQEEHEDVDELTLMISRSSDVENICYLCKYLSTGVIGPFITDNYVDFTQVQNNNTNLDNYEYFYFHIDCLIKYNDFVAVNQGKISLQKTIKEIITNNKICWRCETAFATKKCNSENCDRYFHGFNCISKYTIEIQDSQTYCLDCYRAKSMSVEQKLQRKNFNNNLPAGVEFSSLPREFFERTILSSNNYFPQLKDIAYFAIQPYEDYLRNNFASIIHEIDDIFFWKGNQFTGLNYSVPFLCEIITMEFAFSNEKSIKLIKRLNKAKQNENFRILIKLKLKIIDQRLVGNDKPVHVDIVFFENEQPDFLVAASVYEKRRKNLDEIGVNDTVVVCIGDTDYNAKFIKVIVI
jgi:WD40 repeat protein